MGLFAVLSAACAHTREEVQTATVTAEPAPSSIEREEREVIAMESAAPTEAAAPSRPRPRLSQTITLGQGSEPQYTPAAPAVVHPAQGPNVVVNNNNNVVVQGTPGYYGYGSYYNHGGYGRPTTFYSNDGRSGGSRGTSQWGSSGWEGARRTAAPGQTPGIGGNWAPPPSYGPAQMK